jgi:hypothetical protein
MAYKIKIPKRKEKQETNRPKYLVEGYRWFDKINGNTYHTVFITDLDTGETIYKSPYMEYGYGEQYQQTAFDELKKLGFVKDEDRFNHELNRKRFIYRVTDVNRKKDLL